MSEESKFYLNEYTCYECGNSWQDHWDCQPEDDCPACGARHCTPVKSTEVPVEKVPEGALEEIARASQTPESTCAWKIAEAEAFDTLKRAGYDGGVLQLLRESKRKIVTLAIADDDSGLTPIMCLSSELQTTADVAGKLITLGLLKDELDQYAHVFDSGDHLVRDLDGVEKAPNQYD